jgi:hypothetical protein
MSFCVACLDMETILKKFLLIERDLFFIFEHDEGRDRASAT